MSKQRIKKEYISIGETAEMIDVSPSTVRKLIANNILNAYYVTQSLPRLKLSEVEAYMQRKQQRG